MTDEQCANLLRELADEVLGALNACNLSGVVHSFSKACTSLWNIAHHEDHGTDWVNTHPICILYSSKVAGLTGREDLSTEAVDRFSVAYDAVNMMSKPLLTTDTVPQPITDVVAQAIRRSFPKECEDILKTLHWNAFGRHFYFERWGMYVGVETDGYIHS